LSIRRERRRWPRVALNPPELGFLSPLSSSPPTPPHYVDVLNRSKGGILLRSQHRMEPHTSFILKVYEPLGRTWRSYRGRISWIRKEVGHDGSFLVGVALDTPPPSMEAELESPLVDGMRPRPSDYEFFLGTKLLRSIPREAFCRILNSLFYRSLRAGERLMSQGEEGNSFYLIRSGSCVVQTEKDGRLHPVTRLQTGDIVGEMAVLTGEPRNAHVDAETDMALWGITREQFDRIAAIHPEIRGFLTELVTHRFATSHLTPDRTIGKYVIKEIIGKGGYSIVYRGVHAELNMPVAIKMLKHDMAMEEEFLRQFREEAKTIASLNHENIVKIYDIEERFRTVFIVMEYLEGISLDDLLIKIVRLPPQRTVNILIQVCRGLRYAHQRGVVHLDLKPANIYLQNNDQVKILDFGLACSTGKEVFDLCGTPFYMAPEQIEGRGVDHRSDLYSLGITAYEMLTGERPFPEEDLLKLMDLHVKEDIPDPRQRIPDLPEGLCAFIAKATQRDPSLRYQSLDEALCDLTRVAESLGITEPGRHRPARRMMGLFLFYNEDQRLLLNELLEEFAKKAKEHGLHLKSTDLQDLPW